MNIQAVIKDVKTINTGSVGTVNQPMAEITVEFITEGLAEVNEIKFNVMLCDLNLPDEELTAFLSDMVKEYIRTSIRGKEVLDESNKWVGTERITGLQFDVEV